METPAAVRVTTDVNNNPSR